MKTDNTTFNTKKILEIHNQKLNFNSIPKIICPLCKENEPLLLRIKKDYINRSFFILFSCKCSNTPQEISLNKYYEILSSNKIKSNFKCFKHLEKEAVEYCENCQKFFCNVCQIYHKDLINGHKRIPVKYLNICKKHMNGNKINSYCEKCKKELCSICDLNNHNQHNIISIQDYWNKVKDKLQFNSTQELERKLNNEKKNFENVIINSLEKITFLINKFEKLRGLIFDYYYFSNESNKIFSEIILSSFNQFFHSKDYPDYINIHNCENLIPCNLVAYEECLELEKIFNGFLNVFDALTICESSIIKKDLIKIHEIHNPNHANSNKNNTNKNTNNNDINNNTNNNNNHNLNNNNNLNNANSNNNNKNNNNNNNNNNLNNANSNNKYNNNNINNINSNININNSHNNKEGSESVNSIINGEMISTQSSIKREQEIIKSGNSFLNKKTKPGIENKNKSKHIFKIPINEIKKLNETNKNINNNKNNNNNNNIKNNNNKLDENNNNKLDENNNNKLEENNKNNKLEENNNNKLEENNNNNNNNNNKLEENTSKITLNDKKDNFTLDTMISKKYLDSHSNDFLETFSLYSLQDNYDFIHVGNDSIKVIKNKKKKSEETNETNNNTLTINENLNEQIKNENANFFESIFYNHIE